jgi:hypothetical protein
MAELDLDENGLLYGKTYCQICDNVHADTRKLNPIRWCCTKVPTRPGFMRVSFDHSPDPPYAPCRFVHPYGDDENCSMFEPIRKQEKKDAA